MKKLIIVTLITTCVALCAAVWPHNNATEQTPVPAAETTVSTKEATVAEIEERAALAEKEKETILRQESPQEEQPELETEPIEMPVAPACQPSTEQISTKNSAPEPTPPQASIELQPGDEVYILGFGWVPYEGPNHREYAADMYENGNKIGSMG